MKIRERINLAAGILFTLIIGTLLHFTYEWSGENPFVALYSPVNESVWEHLKLLFFPVLLYTFFEIIVLYKTSGHFLTSRLLAVCIGMFFIASAFFTYTGLLGRDFLALDILIFIFSVLLTFFLSRCFEVRCPGLRLPLLAVYVLLILRGVTVVARARRSFEMLLGCGVLAMLGIQTFMIVAGVIKMIPLTGVTMPFLS